MLFKTAFPDGFTGYIMVLLWIVVPVSAFSLLTIVLLHYGRRWKRDVYGEESESAVVALSSPEQFCYRANDGRFIYLDHTGLLKEFNDKLVYSHAKCAALQQDLKKLRLLAGSPDQTGMEQNNINLNNMEYINTVMEPGLAQAEENKITPAGGVNEIAYLNDLLAERDKQIAFLQHQADLRIKSYHYAEGEKETLRLQLKKLEQEQSGADEKLENLKSIIADKEDAVKQMQAFTGECRQELAETRQALASKQDQLVYAGHQLQEAGEQNQLLQAALADAEQKCTSLEEQCRTNESRLMAMEQKLEARKKMIQRLYIEFASCLEDEIKEAPVVALPQGFAGNEWESPMIL